MTYIKRDQGYSWLVMCVCFLHNTIVSSVFLSGSVYMVDWSEYFTGATKAQIGLVTSMFGAVQCIAGLFCGPLINKYGCMAVCRVGTSIAFVGLVGSFMAPSISWLYFTYGIVLGIGHGLSFIPPIIIIQYYFDKKRALATGISQTGYSCGMFVMIPLLRFLVGIYGWRGTMLLHAGIVLQLWVLSGFYVKPHIPELHTEAHDSKKDSDNNTSNGDVLAVGQTAENKHKSGLFEQIRHFFRTTWDFSVLANPVIMQYLIATVCSFLAVELMYKFSSLKAVLDGVDKVQATMLPAILGAVSMCSRFVSSFVANLPRVNRVLLAGSAMVCMGISVILYSFTDTFRGYAIFVAIFAAFMGVQNTLLVTIQVDLVGVKKMVTSQSFYCGMSVFPLMFSLSMAGLMIDKTGNTDLPFRIYGTVQLIAGIVILFIPLTQRYYHPTDTQNTEKETLKPPSLFNPQLSLINEEDAVLHMSLQSLTSFG